MTREQLAQGLLAPTWATTLRLPDGRRATIQGIIREDDSGRIFSVAVLVDGQHELHTVEVED